MRRQDMNPERELFGNEGHQNRLRTTSRIDLSRMMVSSVLWCVVACLAVLVGLLVVVHTRREVVAQAKDTTTSSVTPLFSSTDLWVSRSKDAVRSMAFGDYTNDGYLDLVVASETNVRMYQNEFGMIDSGADWEVKGDARDVAWGDVDNDGDLDLAVAGGATLANHVYLNMQGTFIVTPTWALEEQSTSSAIAWADYTGDGYLDLAVANEDAPVRLYANQNGNLATRATWVSTETTGTLDLVWGDIDNDGDPDLAVAGKDRVRVYRNDQGRLTSGAVWTSAETGEFTSVAWADYDHDGDVDLAAAGTKMPIFLYENQPDVYSIAGASLKPQPVWSGLSEDPKRSVRSLAWGDYDNDGDLDLAVGVYEHFNLVYRNDYGTLNEVWKDGTQYRTESLSWGDVDNDGDLDLACGNRGQTSFVMRHNGYGLLTSAVHVASDTVVSMAWADVVGSDTRPDMITASKDSTQKMTIQVYQNTSTSFASSFALHQSLPVAGGMCVTSMAPADYDQDGDVDLAVGMTGCYGNSKGASNVVYRNDNGTFGTLPAWTSVEEELTNDIAWGDSDGDGYLDLAVANGAGAPDRIYYNQRGTLDQSGVYWVSSRDDDSTSVAWGDRDGDGDQELAFGTNGQDVMYDNDRGTISTEPFWQSKEVDTTTRIVWVDYDGDGDFDLSIGCANTINKVYRNDEGTLTTVSAWRSAENERTTDIAWGDVDGDGDLDLATSNDSCSTRLYRNDSVIGEDMNRGSVWSSTEVAKSTHQTYAIDWVDYDSDGDLDLVTACSTGVLLYVNTRDALISANPLPLVSVDTPVVLGILEQATIDIRYTLKHSDSVPVRAISTTFSVNGGGSWLPATPTSTTLTTTLRTSPSGVEHTFTWHVNASDFFGQSDAVVVRVNAIPSLIRDSATHHIPGPYQRGSYAAATNIFRARGSQIQVLYHSKPVSDVLVYRLPVGDQGKALAYTRDDGTAYRTDRHGYLQGQEILSMGDRLTALLPMTSTDKYSMYLTSSKASAQGLDAYVVQKLQGKDTIRIADDAPLIIFDLDVSLEWDARYDTAYLAQLEFDLWRASQYLYAWTGGQVALGDITIYHNREQWDEADVVVFATNGLRPNANQGGIVSQTITDMDNIRVTYSDGQVRMGSSWNRYGSSSGILGEDWPRTLAHELGHYLLFLDDNYIGLHDDGTMAPVSTCKGAMSNPYRKDYGAFHPNTDWLPGCAESLSNQITGRSDWRTITTFYPILKAPSSPFWDFVADVPKTLLLDMTDIEPVIPQYQDNTLDEPIFHIVDSEGQRFNPDSSTQAYVFKADSRKPEWYSYIMDLGSPMVDQIHARGISPGDRLCLYDTEHYLQGCRDASNDSDVLSMVAFPDWQPDIIITPITAKTLVVSVTHVTQGLTLATQLYQRSSGSNAASERFDLRYDATTAAYTGTLKLADAVLSGFLHVWVNEDEPRREALASYSIGGGVVEEENEISSALMYSPDSPRVQQRPRPNRRPAPTGRGYASPAVSADGQVMLFGKDLNFADGEFYTLQTATRIPFHPSWLSVVGKAYRLMATDNTPSLEKASISITYLEKDVPQGMEDWITIYFWDGQTWIRLPSRLDMDENMVSAPVQGKGLYALMTTMEIPLHKAGWNLFAYPLHITLNVAQALASIQGSYTTVYGYEPTSGNVWEGYTLFDTDVPAWVNTLDSLTFGAGYWVYVTQPVTIGLNDAIVYSDTKTLAQALPWPPATYYIEGLASGDFVPTTGMTVTAWISPTVCGATTVQEYDGKPVFAIHVAPEMGGKPGCGAPGKMVTFQVGTHSLTQTVLWDNSRPFDLGAIRHVYLPVVMRE